MLTFLIPLVLVSVALGLCMIGGGTSIHLISSETSGMPPGSQLIKSMPQMQIWPISCSVFEEVNKVVVVWQNQVFSLTSLIFLSLH